MTKLDVHLLGCANRGFEAFIQGLPCVPPYVFSPRAKGLYRQRCEHWVAGWKEAQAKHPAPPPRSVINEK